MVPITPGMIFLSRTLPTLGLALIALLGVRILLVTTLHIRISIPAIIAGLSILLPVIVLVHHGLNLMSERRRARNMGARIVPKVVGKLPGNLDILIRMVHNVRNGYPGESSNDYIR